MVVAGTLILYMLPTIIATLRRKHNATAIFIVNLFLGWLVIPWFVTLIWAMLHDSKPVVVVVNPTTTN